MCSYVHGSGCTHWHRCPCWHVVIYYLAYSDTLMWLPLCNVFVTVIATVHITFPHKVSRGGSQRWSQLKAGVLLGGSVGVSSLNASDWRSAEEKCCVYVGTFVAAQCSIPYIERLSLKEKTAVLSETLSLKQSFVNLMMLKRKENNARVCRFIDYQI